MARFGQVQKANVSAVSFLDTREIYKYMIDITQEKPSFSAMMKIIDRFEPTAQTNYHNFVNVELFSTEQITDSAVTVHTANTDITVRVSTANGESFPRVGEIVQIPGANRRTALVIAKTSDAGGDLLRLKSVTGQALELADDQIISVTGSAAGEGGTFLQHRKYFPVKRQNNVHIFAEDISEMTDVQLATLVELAPGKYAYFDEINGLLVMQKNVSNHLLFGEGSGDNFITTSPTLTDPSGNALSTTRGINSYIASEGINLSGQTIGETLMNTLKRQYTKKRVMTDFMMLGGAEMEIQATQFLFNLNGGAAALSDAMRWMTQNEIEIGVTGWKFNGMKFRMQPLASFDEPGIVNFTGSAGYQNFVFLLPTAPVKTVNGGTAPGVRVRYLPVPAGNGANSASDGIYRTTKTGNYAEVPTDKNRKLTISCETKQGVELLNAPHCARIILQASGS